jgi:hypothetical protein
LNSFSKVSRHGGAADQEMARIQAAPELDRERLHHRGQRRRDKVYMGLQVSPKAAVIIASAAATEWTIFERWQIAADVPGLHLFQTKTVKWFLKPHQTLLFFLLGSSLTSRSSRFS